MTSTDDVCEVIITAPDAEWLATFVRKLVDRKLCAAAQNVAPIRSIYRWKGQVEDVTEARVALHTRRCLVGPVVTLTKREHPYEVPCVAVLPIDGGNPDYIQWILDETLTSPPADSAPTAL
jgi:periplasmic divalent cation tolerance protein